jgi:hypothetical protein
MDRKQLIRDYRQRKTPMGVLRVYNTVTGHALVAGSRDLPSDLNSHRAQLSMGGHGSRQLSAEWKEYGSAAFVFEILDTLPPSDLPDYDPLDDLTVLEDMWLEKLSLQPDRLYTINPRRLPPPSIGGRAP